MGKQIGIIYHPKAEEARLFSDELMRTISSGGVSVWFCSSLDEEQMGTLIPDVDLVITVGGDGTILKVARFAVHYEIPIVGINMGGIGFLTELEVNEVGEKLPSLLEGNGWVDKRATIEAEILSSGDEKKGGGSACSLFYALNDVVVGRGAVCRLVYVKAYIDGEYLTTYRADGVLVCSATGSTGYNLAAGGPILYPQSKELVLNPISPYLSLPVALVLSPSSIIELEVSTNHQAILSIDGQTGLDLDSGSRIRIKHSPYSARFLRGYPVSAFYSRLEQRLRRRVEGRKSNDWRCASYTRAG